MIFFREAVGNGCLYFYRKAGSYDRDDYRRDDRAGIDRGGLFRVYQAAEYSSRQAEGTAEEINQRQTLIP